MTTGALYLDDRIADDPTITDLSSDAFRAYLLGHRYAHRHGAER